MASAAVQSFSNEHTTTTFEPLDTVQKGTTKHHVRTILNYHKPNEDGSPPAPAYVNRPETYERPVDPVEVTVYDIKGETDKFTLDGAGFQIYNYPSAEKDFVDDEKIKAEYYPETEKLLKEATGASRIFIFDHTVRRGSKDSRTTNGQDPSNPHPVRGPVNRVHIDQSYSASRSRVPHHLPDDAEHLLAHRHQIINVWRPIKRILKDPLTVADAHSVSETDLVPIGLIYPNRKGETLGVLFNKSHKFYYLYGQTPEEVILIKCYDSKLDGRARRVPHTAFTNPETENEETRESIEVRALVFHEDEDAE